MAQRRDQLPAGLTESEILCVVYDYIGVEDGYLKEFTYRFHQDFYPRYCDLSFAVAELRKAHRTTKETFLAILRSAKPADQARIVEGVFKFLPLEKFPEVARPSKSGARKELLNAVARLRGQAVVTDDLAVESNAVALALKDAAVLIERNGNVSGVDRVHTALHGYLRTLCRSYEVEVPADADVTKLFRALREGIPSLKPGGPRQGEISKIQNALATILDALNPIRNQASLAHPNEILLEVDEAALVIDATRSLLNYLNHKVSPKSR